jgi:uncharacterized tellurite resistance protein B-like protein
VLVRRQRRELIGTAWTARPRQPADFSCPGCGKDGEARRTVLQCHVTVLDRPVARLGSPETYITCRHCGRAYCTDSLNGGRGSTGLSADEAALAGLVAAVVFSDSVVRKVEKEMARQVISEYTGRDYPPMEANEMLQRARRRWGDPVARLEKLAGVISESTRRRMLIGAYRVCAADGELHREESRLLDRVGDALDLSPRDVRVALRQAKAGWPTR